MGRAAARKAASRPARQPAPVVVDRKPATLIERAFAPVDIASLACFRIAFGAVMLVGGRPLLSERMDLHLLHRLRSSTSPTTASGG